MTIDDFDAFLRRLDDLIEGRIRDELYDEGDGEAWDDLVAGVEWVAASKAQTRGGEPPAVEDVLWSLATLGLFPKTENEPWTAYADGLRMSRAPDDPEASMVRRFRAALFRDRARGAPVPATIHAHDFDFAQGSVLDYLVPHPDVPSVQISIDDLHRDLRDEAAIVGYIDSVRADARSRG